MQSFRYFGVITTSILFLIGCATNSNLKAIASEEQTLSYEDNFQYLTSNKNQYNVRIFPAKEIIEPYQPAEFGLYIYNGTEDNLNFSQENICVYCGKKNLKIFAYEEALSDFKKNKEVSLFGLTPGQIGQVADTRSKTHYYENQNREYKQYASFLLKRQTIPPKTLYRGIFKISSPNPVCDDKIVVEVGDKREIHKFVFQLLK